jgi:uncharacterized protein YecT (DUF1311 family)
LQILRLDARSLKSAAIVAALSVASGEANAFDCAKAKTLVEKAICADSSARAADEAMGAAFMALLASADAKQRTAITNGQIDWLQTRNSACEDSQGAEFAACLARESDHRRAFLEGRSEEGPGAANQLVPWFRYEKGGKGKAAVDLELLTFVEPKNAGERALNDQRAAILKEIEQPGKDDLGADHFAYDYHMRLIYGSPKLLSLQTESFVDSGGAHPNSAIVNFNLNAESGTVATFESAFDPKAAEKLFAICLDQVKAQKKARLGEDAPHSEEDLKELAKNIRSATEHMESWSFGATQARVIYNPYDVGAYVEGAYDCKIGYDQLRPLTKPGFPLP